MRSEFSQVMERLLDVTGIFDRVEWGQVLGEDPWTIAGWILDRDIPRPEVLRSIIRLLSETDGVPKLEIQRFFEMAQKPANQVSPLAAKIGPTVEHYMVLPLRNGFLRVLDTLPPAVQEEVLYKAAEDARSKVK